MDRERIDAYLEKVGSSLLQTWQPSGSKLRVGLDLGTANLVIVVLDEDGKPLASELRQASVVRDGVVVDYFGAICLVKEMKVALEERLDCQLDTCAIAMPGNTEDSVQVHRHVAESAGLEVCRVLDEPTAANEVLQVQNGAVVDVGGGTTGIAVFQDGQVIFTDDEPTGGVHLSLALAGHFHIPLEEAEKLKQEPDRQRELYPMAVPVLEKMASIVRRQIAGRTVEQVVLCGGTCRLNGVERVFQKRLDIPVWKPADPLLVTPAGIALCCE